MVDAKTLNALPRVGETSLPLPLFRRGKVRDTYILDDRHLLMVATDRISAFDVVLPTPIPLKGAVLTMLSRFWFEQTADLVPNHLVEVILDPKQAAGLGDPNLVGRAMVVRRAERVDIECVVRGYLAGSAWDEYRRTGEVCGIRLPAGLREADRLPEPIFTPATKAETGHDENISFEQMASLVGEGLARQLKDLSLKLYSRAAQVAEGRGIIIADTKFEFGLLDGQIIVIDELLTPDSSRFWDAALYQPGRSQPSFDKQYVRDWLIQSGWNREPPAPPLPEDVVAGTVSRYLEAYSRLTGKDLLAELGLA
jgi:phosphoribosylaminoimidazole-succinocarboxamide synthase